MHSGLAEDIGEAREIWRSRRISVIGIIGVISVICSGEIMPILYPITAQKKARSKMERALR